MDCRKRFVKQCIWPAVSAESSYNTLFYVIVHSLELEDHISRLKILSNSKKDQGTSIKANLVDKYLYIAYSIY